MSRRKAPQSAEGVALIVLAVASLATAAVQQVMMARILREVSKPAPLPARRSRPQPGPSPRWTQPATGPIDISPVLPQHPHAVTADGPRRSHIV